MYCFCVFVAKQLILCKIIGVGGVSLLYISEYFADII